MCGELEDKVKDDVISAMMSVKEEMNVHKKQLDQSNTIMANLKTYDKKRAKFQREVCVQSQGITESMITRVVVTKTQTKCLSHICDFFVYNFSDLVGYNRQVNSRMWYLEEKQTYVKASFNTDNTVEACTWMLS